MHQSQDTPPEETVEIDDMQALLIQEHLIYVDADSLGEAITVLCRARRTYAALIRNSDAGLAAELLNDVEEAASILDELAEEMRSILQPMDEEEISQPSLPDAGI